MNSNIAGFLGLVAYDPGRKGAKGARLELSLSLELIISADSIPVAQPIVCCKAG